MQSLPLGTCSLLPHFQLHQHSLSSFRPRTSLTSSSASSKSLPSAAGFRRNSFLIRDPKRIHLGSPVPPVRCGASSDRNGAESERSLIQWVELIGEGLSTAFPVWVALGCLLGLLRPASFDWVQPRWTVLGITLTMLGMGMTLTLDDLRAAMAMPKELISGFLLQYSVMPISGFLVSKLLNLPSYYAAGLILVGCCPGGTASNIVTYIARGNVALSVLMTAASTMAAVIMTPFLTAKLAGQFVAVDAAGLLLSTLQIVLLPVVAGAFLNQYFHSMVRLISPLMPPLAVGTVAVLCGNAIAQSSSAILTSGKQVLLAASLLHASGFFFGYVLARMLGIDVSSSRTISIEVGMQNSVLGVVLATQHFGNPLTAVPCAVSSVCHSIFGSVLACVQELAKQPIIEVPPRYLRHFQIAASASEIPVIDMSKLLSDSATDSELARLHSACENWGFFQLVKHGVRDSVIESMKIEAQRLFDLEMEEKKKLWQMEGDVEGFGQAFVASEEQKLDWSDIFFLATAPAHLRKPRLFQNLPLSFRNAMEEYSAEVKDLAAAILRQFERALKITDGELTEMFTDGNQTMRMNYYPPCPDPEKVIGVTPHSDAVGFTILLQINQVEGLKIKKDGNWIAVTPLPNAFIVNIGDLMEMITNGKYKSIEHCATVNSKSERLSIATFNNPRFDKEIKSPSSLITHHSPPLFKTLTYQEFVSGLFARELNGKSYLDTMRIHRPT